MCRRKQSGRTGSDTENEMMQVAVAVALVAAWCAMKAINWLAAKAKRRKHALVCEEIVRAAGTVGFGVAALLAFAAIVCGVGAIAGWMSFDSETIESVAAVVATALAIACVGAMALFACCDDAPEDTYKRLV